MVKTDDRTKKRKKQKQQHRRRRYHNAPCVPIVHHAKENGRRASEREREREGSAQSQANENLKNDNNYKITVHISPERSGYITWKWRCACAHIASHQLTTRRRHHQNRPRQVASFPLNQSSNKWNSMISLLPIFDFFFFIFLFSFLRLPNGMSFAGNRWRVML